MSQTSRFIRPLIEFFFPGASPETILLIHAFIRKSAHFIEYGLLGLLAGTIGATGGGVLSWAVSRYVIETPWHPPTAETGIGVVLTTALVAVVGLVSNLDVLRRKPLATLRAE